MYSVSGTASRPGIGTDLWCVDRGNGKQKSTLTQTETDTMLAATANKLKNRAPPVGK